MVRVQQNPTSIKEWRDGFQGHPWWRKSLSELAVTNPADLEWEVLEQAHPVITSLCPKAQRLYAEGIRMGLLFTHGGVRMRRNGVLLVNTPGYVGTLRHMPMESRAFWSFEGEGASDQEDSESVTSEDDKIESTIEQEV